VNAPGFPVAPPARARGRSWFLVDPRLLAFHAWARRAYGNQEQLARTVMTSRAHLSQVLRGARCGRHTWKRLVRVLPEEGLELLQQLPTWNSAATVALAQRRAPQAWGAPVSSP
jgi:hypothetical protein